MNRSRSILGIALAVGAMLALAGASSAYASTVQTESSPATVQGAGSEANHYLTFNYAGKRTCGAPSLNGEVSAGSNAIELTPKDTECSVNSPLDMGDCHFIFHTGVELPDKTYLGTMDIGPAKCGPITLKSSCIYTISAQNGLPVRYENVGEKSSRSFRIKSEITGMKYTQSGGLCSGTYENGKYEGTWNITAKDASEAKQGIWINSPHVPRFEAESTPATVDGSDDASDPVELTLGAIRLSCGDTSVDAEMPFGSMSFLGLFPTFSECESESIPSGGLTVATYNPNSCYLRTWANDSGSPYKGTLDIACTKSGDVIEVNTGLCKIKLGEQSGLSVSEIANVGSNGKTHQVRTVIAGSGLKYSVTNVFLCPNKAGEYSNGTIEGSLTLSGFNEASQQVGLYVTGHS